MILLPQMIKNLYLSSLTLTIFFIASTFLDFIPFLTNPLLYGF